MGDACENRAGGAGQQLRRIVPQYRVHRLDGGSAGEGAASGEHLVEQRAKGKDVAAMIGGLAAHLLRRHVPGGPEHQAWRRHGKRGHGRCVPVGRYEPGDAEVQDLGAPLGSHEDVVGLQIAMDDPLLVRGGQAGRDLHGQIAGSPWRQRSAREERAQGLAFEQLRHDVRHVAVDVHVEDDDDPGVVEGGGGPGLLREPGQALGIACELRGQDLDGDVTAQPRVESPVNLAHAAGADGRNDFVRPEPGTCGEGHRAIIGRYLFRCRTRGNSLEEVAQ